MLRTRKVVTWLKLRQRTRTEKYINSLIMISFLFLNTWSQIPFSSSCMHFQSLLFFCRTVAHLFLCIGLYSRDAVVLIVGYRWPRNDWFEMICFRNNKSKGFHPKNWILICRSYLGGFQNIFKNFETLCFVLKASQRFTVFQNLVGGKKVVNLLPAKIQVFK